MNRQQAIEAIKKGTHVLDVERHSEEAERFVTGEFDCTYYNGDRFYGKDKDGDLIFIYPYEINGRPIIKLSDILESTKETAISETKDMREYDEKLLKSFAHRYESMETLLTIFEYVPVFLRNRYPNKELEELIKQREELDKRINELK